MPRRLPSGLAGIANIPHAEAAPNLRRAVPIQAPVTQRLAEQGASI